MDIFGISSAKLILIFIIAIILLGPDQVPVIVKTVGKTIRDFRKFVNETTKEFNDVTGDIRKEFTDTVGDLRSEIASTQAELKSQFDFSDVMSPITAAMRDPLGTLTTPTAPESAPVLAAGAATVNEANPLATQTVPYTPPQPMAAFATPEPEAPSPPLISPPCPRRSRLRCRPHMPNRLQRNERRQQRCDASQRQWQRHCQLLQPACDKGRSLR